MKKIIKAIIITAIGIILLVIGLFTLKYFMATKYFKIGKSNGVYYSVVGHQCKEESGLYKSGYNSKGVCNSDGYHIVNKNKVFITATTTCGVNL